MAFTEYFADNATTTLANSVAIADITITVNPPDVDFPFPTKFPYRIRIGNEYMLVTSASGLTWTVTRGEEGSTITIHNNLDEVANVFTVESLMNSAWTYCQEGSRAVLPAPDPTLEGRFFFQDDPGIYIKSDDGTGWSSWGTFFALYEPDEVGFSWINQQTATTSTTQGGVILTSPAPLAPGDNINLRIQTVPATPYTIKAGFIPLLYPVNQTSAGLLFRENTNKIIFFRLMFDNTSTLKTDLVLSVDKYTNSTTFFANYKVASANIFKSSLIWFSVTDDGANLTFSYSTNNINYTDFYQVARNDFFTVGPNEVGYAINSNNTSGNAVLTLLSWQIL